MNIPSDAVHAVERLGYTPSEAAFLYLVANHSGYFLPRQFNAFAEAGWGNRSQRFIRKLERWGHATWREYLGVGGVYHLFSKTIYRELDRDNLRNRRRHSTEFIRTHLLLLDFILQNQSYNYLETEQAKLNYFCEELHLPPKALPAKSYVTASGHESAIRYFVDGYPLYLDSSTGSSAPLLTLTYVDPGRASLAGLRHHLRAYSPLFRHLGDFRFLYISDSTVHFAKAEECFDSLVITSPQQGLTHDISRYFRLRSAWSAKQYGTFSSDDIEWLNQAHLRFEGPETEDLYSRWSEGKLTEEGLRILVEKSPPHRKIQFSAYLVGKPDTRHNKMRSEE